MFPLPFSYIFVNDYCLKEIIILLLTLQFYFLGPSTGGGKEASGVQESLG